MNSSFKLLKGLDWRNFCASPVSFALTIKKNRCLWFGYTSFSMSRLDFSNAGKDCLSVYVLTNCMADFASR